MNDRQFEETADAAPAAAPAVGDEETAAVAAVSEGARLWSEWFLFSVPVGGHGYPYKGDHRGVVAGIDALIAERDQLRDRLAEALDAYQSGRDAMRAECDRLRTRVADLETAAQLTAEMTLAGAQRLAEAERERDEAKAEIVRLREWFDGYDGELSPGDAELLRQIRERGKYDPDCRRIAEIIDAAMRTRDNLESDLANIGPVRQAYRETLARLDEVAKERDEARAAGRELVSANAALRRENERLRGGLSYIERCTVDLLNEVSGVIAENARGGALERGKDGEGGE